MDPITITIAPDGTVRCLWTEAVPLHELGQLALQRALSIEFDNRAQAWRVFEPMGRLPVLLALPRNLSGLGTKVPELGAGQS